MKKLLLAVIIILFALPAAYSQRTFEKAPVDSTRQTNSPKVIVSEENAANYFETKNSINYSTLFKFNPLVWLHGDVPIYMEQKIAKRLSVEVSAGLTFKPKLEEVFESTSRANNVTRTHKAGYSFSGALHYYPSENTDMFEGFYLGPEVRYRKYNFYATEVNGIPIDLEQSKTMTDFKFTMGSVRYITDNLFIELYGGLGLRAKTYTNLIKVESERDENTGAETETVRVYNDDQKTPVLSAGFKLGFAL